MAQSLVHNYLRRFGSATCAQISERLDMGLLQCRKDLAILQSEGKGSMGYQAHWRAVPLKHR
jgi:NADH/NAD ratio-sensing transcriptional regulator Rex